jgi:hypothetical protein
MPTGKNWGAHDVSEERGRDREIPILIQLKKFENESACVKVRDSLSLSLSLPRMPSLSHLHTQKVKRLMVKDRG